MLVTLAQDRLRKMYVKFSDEQVGLKGMKPLIQADEILGFLLKNMKL